MRPAGAPAWITSELLARTRAVWQPYYERTLSEQDVLEIVRSAGRLMEALGDADEAIEEICSAGAGE